jgi:hypothetical protein
MLERCVTRRRFLSGASAAAAWLSLPAPLFAGDPVEKPYLGKYAHAGGEREREARDKAIEGVVREMNALIRGIARSKLREANPIPAAVSIASDGKSLSITHDKLVFTAPIHGGSAKVKGVTGDTLDLVHVVTATQLEQRFGNKAQGRINTYTKSAELLVLDVRIYADRLPKDLSYRLTYKKA